VPNEYPQIATADGGVIGVSGITYDSNGNATGQIANMPIYSWKGAYEYGSLDSVSSAFVNISAKFGAVAGGNLTGNGTTLGHQSFGLSWCGTNVVGGLSHCGPAKDLLFLYHNVCSVKKDSDFSGDSQFVAIIENEALNSFKAAFADYPISVVPASKHMKTTWAECQSDPQCLNTDVADQNHVVRVAGDLDASGTGKTYSAALTPPAGVPVTRSDVYYYNVMKDAETALWNYNSSSQNWCPQYPPKANTGDLQKFQMIMKTIGIGIGNAAAHEISHQIIHNFPYVDCGPPTAQGSEGACQSNDNFVYTFYNANALPSDPKDPNSAANGGRVFYEIPGDPLIHWGETDKCWLDYYSKKTNLFQILFTTNPCN